MPENSPDQQGSPFDRIRRVDEYGREYWTGRDLQPLADYSQWRDFVAVIEKAKASLALVQGESAAQDHFAETRNKVQIGSGAQREAQDYRLTRFGAYLTAMAGDDTKQSVAEARVYFAVRTREAELGALTQAEIRETALARAREMIDYQVFRDMMRDNSTDYHPKNPYTRRFFWEMQDRLYLHIVGMTAKEIRSARHLYHWPGREDGKSEPGPKSPHRKVAKNYLAVNELRKLELLVAQLCLRAQYISEDGHSLTMQKWATLVERELDAMARSIAT